MGGDEKLKIIEFFDYGWYRAGYFIRHDFIKILMWTGKFVIGFLMIVIWDLKQFFERKKRKKKKGGVR